jgi:hypothetical protein
MRLLPACPYMRNAVRALSKRKRLSPSSATLAAARGEEATMRRRSSVIGSAIAG